MTTPDIGSLMRFCDSAEARKAHKGVTAIPKMVPGQISATDVADQNANVDSSETTLDEEKSSKRRRDEALEPGQDEEKAKRKKVKVPAA